ncbi:MAG: adenylate kinase [Chloroflexi bacterium RBG_13_51_52]|nr:MAG: adenylate kinase [Chloroflexi bacterium RBG_13_51_52]
MYIILLGAPGAGKGTQAIMLAEKKKLVQVASGDLFRKALQQETELGKKAKVYMEKGHLVPDEITIQMVLERLAEPDCKNGAILDGFPRNLEQAKALDKALGQKSSAIDKVVYIKVSEGELLKRLGGRWICRKCQAPYHEVDSPPKVAGKCDRCGGELYQRADDNVETVKKRLEVYFAETSPLIDYYKRAKKLLEINGEGNTSEVNQRILNALR